ncbi:MAG: hypothetical protein ACRDKZ_02630 [Actinomycetota bacterium]
MKPARGTVLTGLVIVGLVVFGARAILATTHAQSTDDISPAECGLSSPNPALEQRTLPDVARIAGVDIVAVDRRGKFSSASLNVPLSVKDLLDRLRKRARGVGYRVLYEDFEGFEAELFVSIDNQPGVFRILSSRCADFSRLFYQLPT